MLRVEGPSNENDLNAKLAAVIGSHHELISGHPSVPFACARVTSDHIVDSALLVEAKRGTIYVTLERPERKGYVTSWFSDPQAVRGGKARRIFRLKPAGLAAVRASKRAVDRLSAGTILAHPAKGLA